MKQINLIITLENLKDIVSGKKVEEYRRPSRYNASLMFEKNSEDGILDPRKDITHVQFFAGYRKDRKHAIVEVDKIEFNVFEKFIPEGMKPGSNAITIFIRRVVEHNL